MDALAIMTVSGVVVALARLLKWAGLPDRWGRISVFLLSALGVAVWAYAQGHVGRADAFSYVAGWVAVATSAATVFGFAWAGRSRRA